MKLLIGLGNPGDEYKNNRHNVGFMLADFIYNQLHTKAPVSTSFQFDKYSNSDLIIIKQPVEIILSKPQTFMNRSGHTVAKLMMNHKLKLDEIFVAHDDLDIPIGKFKIQKGTGPKLHNGLESIENSIGKEFWRIRIGVENRTPENHIPGEAYVLQNFTQEEQKMIPDTFSLIINRMSLEK